MTALGSDLPGQGGVTVVNPDGRPKIPMVPADVQRLSAARRKRDKAIEDQKRWMDEIEQAACQAYRNGAPVNQIAALAGLTRHTVYKMLHRNGLSDVQLR